MRKLNHPVEKLAELFLYNGASFEVEERPEVLWVGCVDYASNRTDEPDIGATLERYQRLIGISKNVSFCSLLKKDLPTLCKQSPNTLKVNPLWEIGSDDLFF